MKEKSSPQSGCENHLARESQVRVVNVFKVDDEEIDVYGGRADSGDAHINNTEVGEEGWLGNPYPLEEVDDREEAIEKFAVDFFNRLLEDDEFYEAVMDLEGKTLGCFCKPKRCHLDVVAAYVNSGDIDE